MDVSVFSIIPMQCHNPNSVVDVGQALDADFRLQSINTCVSISGCGKLRTNKRVIQKAFQFLFT